VSLLYLLILGQHTDRSLIADLARVTPVAVAVEKDVMKEIKVKFVTLLTRAFNRRFGTLLGVPTCTYGYCAWSGRLRKLRTVISVPIFAL